MALWTFENGCFLIGGQTSRPQQVRTFARTQGWVGFFFDLLIDDFLDCKTVPGA